VTSDEMRDYQVGALDFCADDQVSALKGADLSSWTMRRQYEGKALDGLWEPARGSQAMLMSIHFSAMNP
jgi:hypothetical protein